VLSGEAQPHRLFEPVRPAAAAELQGLFVSRRPSGIRIIILVLYVSKRCW